MKRTVDDSPENCIQWLTAQVARRLTRICAISLREDAVPSLEAELSTVLQQLCAMAQDGLGAHVAYLFCGGELVICVDEHPKWDWVLSAVRVRIGSEVSKHYNGRSDPPQFIRLLQRDHMLVFGHDIYVEDIKAMSPKLVCTPVARDKNSKRLINLALSSVVVEAAKRGRRTRLLSILSFERVGQFQIVRHPFALASRYLRIIRYSVGSVCPERYHRNTALQVRTAICAFGLLCVVALVLIVWNSFRSGEVAASKMPKGFFFGQYRESMSGETVRYGLYLPRRLGDPAEPRSMIVHLHGEESKAKDQFMRVGLPALIAARLGPLDAAFNHVALFPNDPSGKWQVGTTESAKMGKLLEYIVSKHNIDRNKIYLSGIGRGADCVWKLAEMYPEKWAALAVVGASYRPDVDKLQNTPCWVFHGDKDRRVPVAEIRALIAELKTHDCDCRYSELPGLKYGQRMWDSAFTVKLIEWFDGKKRKA